MNSQAHMTALIAVLALIALAGCDSNHDAKLQEAQRNFAETVKSENAALQWQLDDAVAHHLFWRHYDDAPDVPTRAYEEFVRCHDTPPTHDANKKVCADLQARITKEEAREKAKDEREKANW